MSWKKITTTECDNGPASAHNSERYIEVPLAIRWLKTLDPQIKLVEIGAVMPYHIRSFHTVIDPYDEKATIKHPMEKFNYTNKNILCISTIEHIGNLEYGNSEENVDSGAAINALIKILDESNKCFITIPIGWNENLDIWLKNNLERLECFGYEKHGGVYDTSAWPPIPSPTEWTYHDEVTSLDYKYGWEDGSNYIHQSALFVIGITGWK